MSLSNAGAVFARRSHGRGGDMSIFSKIGKGLKKVAKYALPALGIAAPFIPGVRDFVSGAASKIGGMFSAKDASSDFMGPPDPNNPTEGQRVTVNGGAASGGNFLRDAMPGIVGGLNYLGQRQTNAANAEQAQKQMDFQAEQTGTSYQRGVEDMRKAGLNPMLAYSQGGASSGGGASAEMGNEVGAGANSAMSAMQTMAQLKQMNAQTQNVEAQTDFTAAQTETERNKPENVAASTKSLTAGTEKTDVEKRFLLESIKDRLREIHSAADLRKFQAKIEGLGVSKAQAYSDWFDKPGLSGGHSYPMLSAYGEYANSASSVAKDLMPWKGLFSGPKDTSKTTSYNRDSQGRIFEKLEHTR